MNKYYFENKRDDEGVLISYKAYELYNNITEESYNIIKNYKSIKK